MREVLICVHSVFCMLCLQNKSFNNTDTSQLLDTFTNLNLNKLTSLSQTTTNTLIFCLLNCTTEDDTSPLVHSN